MRRRLACAKRRPVATLAARELRQTTEGRIPERMNLGATIDYDAGKSAKELLMQQLGLADQWTD